MKWIIGVWCLGLYPKYFKLSIEVDLFETLGSFFMEKILKRFGNLIEKITLSENMFMAFKEAKKGKANKKKVYDFELNIHYLIYPLTLNFYITYRRHIIQ